MINSITPSTSTSGHESTHSLGQIMKKGSEALLDFCQEVHARAAFRRERCARIQKIRLCADRIKIAFDMPKRVLMGELGLRLEDRRPLSVEEILRLYNDPKTADYFDEELVEAIGAFLAARQHYCALCQAGRAD